MVHSRLSSSAILVSFVLSSRGILTHLFKTWKDEEKRINYAGEFRAMEYFGASSIRKLASRNLQE